MAAAEKGVGHVPCPVKAVPQSDLMKGGVQRERKTNKTIKLRAEVLLTYKKKRTTRGNSAAHYRTLQPRLFSPLMGKDPRDGRVLKVLLYCCSSNRRLSCAGALSSLWSGGSFLLCRRTTHSWPTVVALCFYAVILI